jgi:m7GpppX diphosphatase
MHKKYFLETFEMYQQRINHRNHEKDAWIYDILDGRSESERIIYQDENFMLLPSSSPFLTSELHLLAIPRDKSLKCIRSLTSDHIPLLECIQKKSFSIIKKKYGVDTIAEIHYLPSTFHLHIHFYSVNKANRINFHRRHSLEKIIYNLRRNSYYYHFPLIIQIYC